MKKIITLLSGVCLLTALGTAFAKPDECPSAYQIRQEGTTLTKGFMQNIGQNDFVWFFSSVPYLFNDKFWQTHFIETLPGVTSPADALSMAQNDLNNYSLMTHPDASSSSDTLTVCEYSPVSSNYAVYAINEVGVAFKKSK